MQIDWTFDDGNTGSQGIGGALTATGSTTVSITAVNDAPQGANNTVVATEDTDYIFTAADFGFTDTNDSIANNFINVIIASAPANGTLYLDANADGIVDGGETLTASSVVSVADITAGKLKFKPAADTNGSGYDSFTFQVQDDGGVVNGGVDTDQTANTITIDVTAVNDAPTAANNTVTTNEDTTYTFTAADFNYSDIDGDTLASIQITTLETVGALQLSGVDVTLNQVITKADIDAGNLKFVPVADANGSGKIVVRVLRGRIIAIAKIPAPTGD